MKKSIRKCRFIFFDLSFLFIQIVTSTTLLTNTLKGSIKDSRNETLVSVNGTYELGFFSPGKSSNRYLGIWYKKGLNTRVIWVANRETPLVDHSGTLNFSSNGNILLLDGKNNMIWSSNISKPAANPKLQLFDSGNLVLQDSNLKGILWQSFDFPCNTLLGGMKLGRNFLTGFEKSLSAWKSSEDPARGQFSLSIDPRGFPQLVLKNGSATLRRLGSWNGLRFSGTPELKQLSFFKFEFVLNENEVYYSWEALNTVMTMLVVSDSGLLQRWIDQSNSWYNLYHGARDQCDYYSFCGAYSRCSTNKDAASCTCLEGFIPKSSKEWGVSKWSGGCIRRLTLDCDKGNEFRNYTGLKLPDTSRSWFNQSMNLVECKAKCLQNCSCTAYANSNISKEGSGCLLWFGDLIDMREYAEDGQDIYIRMALPQTGQKRKMGTIVGSMILVGAVMLVLILYIWRRKHRDQGRFWRQGFNNFDGNDDMELPMFDLSIIAKATDDFSSNNFLGEGGFGPVYKGILTEGQEIAVKRLSNKSGQGAEEFKNEVLLIAKLQHRNLVKLLGYCIHKDEKMLIYEYMPNRSLDFFIFDPTNTNILEWSGRMLIIDGIARGLLYLHQDSRLRIIHRDLKASNVLLDAEMNPKISDFGMARMFGGDQTEANTNKVVGTYGYMSPEYAIDGLFSMKSDIFSFGVLIIEIVSGRKNRGFRHPDHDHNLLGHAWKLWLENRPMELMDVTLGDNCVVSEVVRCINVGLLCVQKRPEDRPTMSSVVQMLGSESSLPIPNQPGFFNERNMPEAEYASVHEGSSINDLSITVLEPR